MRKKLRHDALFREILNRLGMENSRTKETLRFDGAHSDAAESLFILQELQAIEQQLYETPFGPLDSKVLIPYDFSVPAGAMEWGYDRVTLHGMAQWIAANAKDLPRAEVSRTRATFPIQSMGDSYSYSRLDMLSAMMANMPLDPLLAQAARRAIDSFMDQVLLEGDATVGFSGFVNDANVSITAVAHGKWDGSAATPDQIIVEANRIVSDIGKTTKKNYYPDTLVLPPDQHAYVTTTPRSANSDTTIWEYIQKNNKYLKNIEMLLQAEGAGVGAVDRAIFYKRSPEVVVAKIAIPFEQLPPQQRGFSIEVPVWARIGGTHWRIPIAATYLDGV